MQDDNSGLSTDGKPIVMCGTYGCTLPNNHKGLHCFPVEEGAGRGARKRAKVVEPDEDAAAASAAAADDDPEDPNDSANESEAAEKAPSSKAGRGPRQPKVTVAPEPRPQEAVAGLCKKTPFCQRLKNHPGLCKVPIECHKLLRCTLEFRHPGACRVPPPCNKDPRCGRAGGHSGICRIVNAEPFYVDKISKGKEAKIQVRIKIKLAAPV